MDMNCICPNLEPLLSADSIRNFISFLTFLVAWFAYRAGKNYINKRQEEASVGFHRHLLSYISGMRLLVTAKNMENNYIPLYATWYLLSENMRENGDPNYGNDLKKLSDNYNSYLRMASNQIYPVSCKKKKEKNEWNAKMREIQRYSNIFSVIGSRTFDEYNTDNDIEQQWLTLVEILDWIETKIEPASLC